MTQKAQFGRHVPVEFRNSTQTTQILDSFDHKKSLSVHDSLSRDLNEWTTTKLAADRRRRKTSLRRPTTKDEPPPSYAIVASCLPS